MAENPERAALLTGRELVDVNGDRIGTVEDVRTQGPAAGPTWLIVGVEPPNLGKVLFPAEEVRVWGDRLVAPYHGDYVRGAPVVEDEKALSEDEQRRLCLRYGLDYVSPGTEPAKGCGLCRRRKRAEPPRG